MTERKVGIGILNKNRFVIFKFNNILKYRQSGKNLTIIYFIIALQIID